MIDYLIRLKRRKRSILNDAWVWHMAWRDARHNFSRLFLFIASLVTGIAAVVALDAMNRSLQGDIDAHAKELVGADLVVNSNHPFEKRWTAVFDSIRAPEASQTDMASMVLFLHNGRSRLIRLVALKGPFPFYGSFKTQPADAMEVMKKTRSAILDETLARQYEVSSDDSMKIGKLVFRVAGVVTNNPGGNGILSTFTPSIYISMDQLDSTGLIQFGSRVNYHKYFKTSSIKETDALETALHPIARKYGQRIDTVQRQKQDLGEGFLSVYRFFSLLAFVALILGCIGVASSVHIYAREKREEVAVLRCMGSSGWQAFNIFFIQMTVIGLVGSVIGAFLGISIQQLIPLVAGDFFPVEAKFSFAPESIALGIVLGVVVTVLFSALPLIGVRYVPPLTVLRTDYKMVRIFSKTRIFIIILVLAFPFGFAVLQTGKLLTGILFFLGLIVALFSLAGVAVLLLRLVRRFFPHNAPFVWRHSLSNLFRPNNQTQVLMVTIGLGAFIIATLNVIQHSLLGQVEFTGRQNQSNTIIFDIQPSEKDGVLKLMKDDQLEANQVVPIVTCRLSEVKGRTIEQIQADTSSHVHEWALTREYRVTYRDTLHVSEELTKGELQKKVKGRDSVYVTMSEGMEDDLQVNVGDSLVFDVQGIPIKVRIGGIRKVDWPRDPPNFIFVFPTGVLEQAPQIWVVTTKVDTPQTEARFQQQLITEFPNVSIIDLRLILNTINSLFDKLALIVRFLALFSVITGLVVLAGAVVNSKFIRIRENALLRTVGARSRQIVKMTLIEYAYLGLFSALTGIVLSLISGWLLAHFFFEVTFGVDFLGLLSIGAVVVVLTVLIGWYNSREVIGTPPLQVLRKEV